jgi:hypothetical protein
MEDYGGDEAFEEDPIAEEEDGEGVGGHSGRAVRSDQPQGRAAKAAAAKAAAANPACGQEEDEEDEEELTALAVGELGQKIRTGDTPSPSPFVTQGALSLARSGRESVGLREAESVKEDDNAEDDDENAGSSGAGGGAAADLLGAPPDDFQKASSEAADDASGLPAALSEWLFERAQALGLLRTLRQRLEPWLLARQQSPSPGSAAPVSLADVGALTAQDFDAVLGCKAAEDRGPAHGKLAALAAEARALAASAQSSDRSGRASPSPEGVVARVLGAAPADPLWLGLSVGDSVEARYKGRAKWYAAAVVDAQSAAAHANRQGRRSLAASDMNGGPAVFTVRYEDDGFEEHGVPRLRVRRPGEAEPLVLHAGIRCEARYHGGKQCFPGVVVWANGGGVAPSTQALVEYDDGDKEANVPRDAVFVQCD